jgi:hypothetical protein
MPKNIYLDTKLSLQPKAQIVNAVVKTAALEAVRAQDLRQAGPPDPGAGSRPTARGRTRQSPLLREKNWLGSRLRDGDCGSTGEGLAIGEAAATDGPRWSWPVLLPFSLLILVPEGAAEGGPDLVVDLFRRRVLAEFLL